MANWLDLTDSFSNEMQISEMEKKYNGCFLFLKDPKERLFLVQYKGWDGNCHLFKDEHGATLAVRHETEYEVLCMHPEKKVFNHKDRVLISYSLPLRQYKRGICRDNLMIANPTRQLWEDKNLLSIETLHSAFFNRYYTLEEMLILLQEKKILSGAISSKFSFAQSHTNKPGFYLWFYDIPIGYLEKNVVEILHPMFEQEIQENKDLFVPLKLEFNY